MWGPVENFGKNLILIGFVIIFFGLILVAAGKLPYIGKLPGDILIRKKNFVLYIPIATSILLSIILSILLTLFFRR